MMVSGNAAAKILSLVREAYPEWQGIEDPRFVKDEITYKRKACNEARDRLGPEEFRRLMDAKDYEAIRSRLKKLANATNLLYRSQPATSDIAILARDDLDFPSFVPILFDLLYGDGASTDRLERYLQFVTSHNFPNHWPFPTYFLFLLHPETEFFIKPGVTKDFLKFIGEPLSYSQDPDAAWYGQFLELLHEIRSVLRAEDVHCRDMVDLQSLVWVAVHESRRGFWKIAPGKGAQYWNDWVEQGIAAVGWNEPGDLSDVKDKADFERRIAQCKKEQGLEDWEISSAQLWTFLKQIRPGDRLVANQGKSRVLGLGTVTGKYRFDPQVDQVHIIDVDWDDIEPREVDENGWGKTIVKLDREKFETIQALPPIKGPIERTEVAKIFTDYYPDEGDRRLVCEFLADAVEAAHKENPKVWGLSVRSDKVRLNVGRVAALDCKLHSFRISVLKEEVPEDVLADWGNFDNPVFRFGSIQEATTGFDLPMSEVKENRELVQSLIRSFVLRAAQGALKTPYARFHSKDVTQFLRTFLGREVPDPAGGNSPDSFNPVHSLETVSKATGFGVPVLQRWKRSILRKKQAVFYGPPGTGKTFIADHLARHLIGGGRGFIQVVQFHPSYAYEDFIEGIRPSVNGADSLVYTKERGVFLEFCRKAAEAEGDPCVLIVDEINRAPLSRVFGELMYLLEYRDRKIRLASGREFRIPGNVYLIGTMNTADRSIALVDHALRRRFAFIPLFPQYAVLEAFHAGNGFDAKGLVGLLQEVNHEIGDRNYSLGVSFFMDEELTENIEDIWRMEIEPYLEEYFYDQNGKMEDFRWDRVRQRVLGGEA